MAAPRISAHSAAVSVVKTGGGLLQGDPKTAQLTLSNARYPHGQAIVTMPLPTDAAVLEATNPRRGDVRLQLELRESVGDPVQVAEITDEHAGHVASMTAMFGGSVAAVTERYFDPWNGGSVRGSNVRANLTVTGRSIDHAAGEVTYAAYTDEALAVAYRLLSTTIETSGSLSVRDTVNFALRKIGAVLVPSDVDADVIEAEAIVWAPGVSAWEYIRGVAEPAGLVVRCDQRRRWTLTQREATLPDQVVLDRYVQVNERIDLEGEEYADGVVIRYSWVDPDTGTYKTRYDVASVNDKPIKVITIDRNTPYPGPGAAAYWLTRYNGRGRVFDLDQVNDYQLRPGMGMTTQVPVAPTQLGHIESVDWRVPENTMAIVTTAAISAVPGAISLFPAGLMISDLVGMISDLNPGSEND